MTRFKLDENLPARAAEALRKAGRDFTDIRRQGVSRSPGILVIRLGRQDAGTVCATILSALPDVERESPQGSIWIIEPHRIRVRQPDR